MTDIHPRLAKDRVLDIFKLWLSDYNIDSLPWTVQPDMVEIPFQIPLTDSIVYCGVIDQIGVMKNTGNFVVIDIKTTRQINQRWLRKFSLDTQVSGYLYAAKQHVPQVVGMLLGVIELPDSKVSNSRCKLHGVPYTECDLLHARFDWVGPFTRTDDQLEAWRATAIQLAEKYRNLHTYKEYPDNYDSLPTEGQFVSTEYVNACVACELSNFCNDSRPFHMMDNYLQDSPWFCFKELLT